MRAIFILICLSGVLGQAAAPAATARSPFMGTWAIDVAKVPLPPELRPKSVTMTFEDAGGGRWKSTVDIVRPDGSTSHSVSTYRLDGSPMPIAGDNDADHVAITSPLPTVLIMALSKKGTPGNIRVFTILRDGNTEVETHVYETPQGYLSMKSAEWKRVR